MYTRGLSLLQHNAEFYETAYTQSIVDGIYI